MGVSRRREHAMRDAWIIFTDEVRRLFANVVSVVIALGLVAMPSIFAWYNIIACWDVFDHTGNLAVAVANTDEGYQSDLIPLRVNIGEQVVSALRANEQIDWLFTDESDAVDGARSGRYYAAVVIPKDFSRDMLTFFKGDAQQASIIYYSNEKKSAIAPKITDRGADTVSYEVNQVFAQTMSEVAISLGEALARYADEADVSGQVQQLADHIGNVGRRMEQAAQVLELYGELGQDAAGLISSSTALATAAEEQANQLKNAASSGADALGPLIQSLTDTVKALGEAFEQGSAGMEALAAATDKLFDDAGVAATDATAALRAEADSLTGMINGYRNLADQLEALAPGMDAAYQQAMEEAVRLLRLQADLMAQTQQQLREAADQLDAGSANLSEERAQTKALVAEAQANLRKARDSFVALRPGLEQIAQEAADLAQSVQSSLSTLGGAGAVLSSTASTAADALAVGNGKISDVAADLRRSAEAMDAVSRGIEEALISGDADQLRGILTSDASAFAGALAAPVGIDREAIYPAENFGSQMAPLYTTLALFIGSLLILVVIKPRSCKATLKRVPTAKPRSVFLGHFGIMAALSLAQTTLTAVGNMLFLHVQVAHPFLYLLIFWLAGLVFTFIIYALVVSFANLGKAIAVLMLIIQVTGCGGSFPLQILPSFVQAVSPFLPATYVVGAMREAMMGTYGMVYWDQVCCLLVFLVPAALLGLALRKPLERFMRWYVAQVDKSELMA